MSGSLPDMMDMCLCGHDYGTHDDRNRCGGCRCKTFRSKRRGASEPAAELEGAAELESIRRGLARVEAQTKSEIAEVWRAIWQLRRQRDRRKAQ